MGIFDAIRSQFIEVIEWLDPTNDTMVYRFPVANNEIKMGAKQTKDLTADQLGAPMKSSGFMSGCGLPDSSNAEICAAVKQGKPLGVSVKVNPSNNKIAACIDRSVRKLSFPKSEKLDVVKQTF